MMLDEEYLCAMCMNGYHRGSYIITFKKGFRMKLKTYRVSIALLLSLCGSQVSARVITGTIRHAVTTLHTKLEAENRTSELSADFLHVYDSILRTVI